MRNQTLLNSVFNTYRQASVIGAGEHDSTHNQISVIGLEYNHGIMGNIGYNPDGLVGLPGDGYVYSWIGDCALGSV